MAAFHGSFLSVTLLEKARGSVNLPETCGAATSFKLRAMPLLPPPPSSQPVRGAKRRLVVAAIGVALFFAGVAAWTAVSPGAYGQSRAGCVTVTIPSSTGGALLHQCGTRARIMCRGAFLSRDRLSLLIRRPCREAGLG
jgi:hypothetical protein